MSNHYAIYPKLKLLCMSTTLYFFFLNSNLKKKKKDNSELHWKTRRKKMLGQAPSWVYVPIFVDVLGSPCPPSSKQMSPPTCSRCSVPKSWTANTGDRLGCGRCRNCNDLFVNFIHGWKRLSSVYEIWRVFTPVCWPSQVMNLGPFTWNTVGGEGSHPCSKKPYPVSHPPRVSGMSSSKCKRTVL